MFTSIGTPVVDDAGGGTRSRGTRLGAADRWFQALDQYTAVVGGERWTLHVMGIHASNSSLWIQLQPAPDVTPGIVLKVSTGTRLERALEVLGAAKGGRDRLHVVDATRKRTAFRGAGRAD